MKMTGNIKWTSIYKPICELIEFNKDYNIPEPISDAPPIIKIDLNNIINTNIINLSDIQILESQLNIISYLKKNVILSIDNITKINVEPFLNLNIYNIFEWLINSSKHLAKSNNLQISTKIIKNTGNLIYRSSYNFCEHKYECPFFYKKNKKCFSKHYVHDMVYTDLTLLFTYIKCYINLINEENISEINRSFHTIYFVLNHMLEELIDGEKFRDDFIIKNKYKKKNNK